LERISKNEMDDLISLKILTQNKVGSYKEVSGDKKIIVTGTNTTDRQHTYSCKNSRHKQRYVTDPIYAKLIEFRDKEKKLFDLDKVKHNQKYLFSECVS